MTFSIDELVANLLLFVLVIVISVLITKLIGKFSKEDPEVIEEESSLEEMLEKPKRQSKNK
ncbi:MAG: hypothetical protein JXQ77_02065 [Campylobacterales bacterium]|nr:hypothetical protein [Campylobacterales bacterium]